MDARQDRAMSEALSTQRSPLGHGARHWRELGYLGWCRQLSMTGAYSSGSSLSPLSKRLNAFPAYLRLPCQTAE